MLLFLYVITIDLILIYFLIFMNSQKLYFFTSRIKTRAKFFTFAVSALCLSSSAGQQ